MWDDALSSASFLFGGVEPAPLMNGISFNPFNDGCGDLINRFDYPRPAAFHQFAGHAPYHRGSFCFRDSAASTSMQLGKSVRPIATHAGHQHATKSRGVVLFQGARHHAFNTWMPWIVALGGYRHPVQAR